MVLAARDWALMLGLVTVDQLTKWIALMYEPNNFLFHFTWNTGAGFGILQGKNTLLLIISLAVLALLWKPLTTAKGYEKLAFIVLCAGIVGNCLDRVLHGAVVDFISIGTFPVFNIADSLITVSILYLIAQSVKEWFPDWNFSKQK